jgi:hypothetical protein
MMSGSAAVGGVVSGTLGESGPQAAPNAPSRSRGINRRAETEERTEVKEEPIMVDVPDRDDATKGGVMPRS